MQERKKRSNSKRKKNQIDRERKCKHRAERNKYTIIITGSASFVLSVVNQPDGTWPSNDCRKMKGMAHTMNRCRRRLPLRQRHPLTGLHDYVASESNRPTMPHAEWMRQMTMMMTTTMKRWMR